MVASQNGFCSYKLSIHKKTNIMQIMTKNITIFLYLIFYHREIRKLDHVMTLSLNYAKTVLWRSRCKIHRFVAAPWLDTNSVSKNMTFDIGWVLALKMLERSWNGYLHRLQCLSLPLFAWYVQFACAYIIMLKILLVIGYRAICYNYKLFNVHLSGLVRFDCLI